MKTEVLNFKLSTETRKKIDALCNYHDKSISQILRDGVDLQVKEITREKTNEHAVRAYKWIEKNIPDDTSDNKLAVLGTLLELQTFWSTGIRTPVDIVIGRAINHHGYVKA